MKRNITFGSAFKCSDKSIRFEKDCIFMGPAEIKFDCINGEINYAIMNFTVMHIGPVGKFILSAYLNTRSSFYKVVSAFNRRFAFHYGRSYTKECARGPETCEDKSSDHGRNGSDQP